MKGGENCFKSFYFKKDRLNQLRGFCMTVQCGCSSIKAAEKLFLEPGSISRQINALEGDLGIKLFERTRNHRLILNESGKAFYERALNIIQSTDNLYKEFATNLEYERNNILKIAGHHTFLSGILPKYLKSILDKKKFKDIKIELLNIHKDDAFERLKNNEIDIAFYPSKINDFPPFELDRKKIFQYKNIMLVHKDNPLANLKIISSNDFNKSPYFFLDKYDFYNPSDSLDLIPSNITFENANWNIIINLVKENLGIVILPKNYLNNIEIMNNTMFKPIEVDNFLTKIYFYMFYKKNIEFKESLKLLINQINDDLKLNNFS